MKAVVYEAYGSPDVLRLREVPTPVPRDDEVLVRVRATTVSAADWRMRSLDVPAGFGIPARLAIGWFRPRQPILGTELAGDVAAVGGAVTRFAVGDAVFAFPGLKMGCHAEYRCLAEDGPVARKPPNLSYEEAAALCFGGTTALDFLRRGEVKAGDAVLVNGASGSVGTAAVQLAKHLGAEVTGVCSTRNLDLVRSLGADHLVDYTREDFTLSGRTYDVIMDSAGTAPFSRVKGSLRPRGRFLAVLASMPEMLVGPWLAWRTGRKVVVGTAAERPEDVRFLGELAASGRYRPVIDRVYPFERIADAHRHVDTRHKRGNVVVTIGDGSG